MVKYMLLVKLLPIAICLRDQLLQGLGWNIYHLWSTDWYRNRDLSRKRLLEAVEFNQKETVKNEILAS